MILLNPKYEHLRAWVSQPETLTAHGMLIHKGRNELFATEAEGIKLCVKHFGLKGLKRFVYRFLRASKGIRAWKNSFALREAGFASPEPVAYVQKNAWYGIADSYYICLFQEGQTLYHWGNKSLAAIEDEVKAFACFAARLHEAGLMLCDFTPGNILRTEDGFALVDTNRMRRRKVSVKQGLRNMAGLWMRPEVAEVLSKTYVHARGEEPQRYAGCFAQYRRAFWRRFTRRHHLTNTITHRDLDGGQYSFAFNTTIR